MSKKRFSGLRLILMVPVVVLLAGGLIIGGRALQEPGEVRTLKKQEVAQTDEGHQEYYFGLLNEDEQRGYREILEGIRSFEDKFYLSLSGDNEIDRVYHAVLKDHPELFWVHNREKVYKTTYSGRDYCLRDILIQRSRDRRSRRLWRMRIRRCYRRFRMVLMITRR